MLLQLFDAIKTVQKPDDYKLVSFDVKLLFSSIPLQLALDCTETAIKIRGCSISNSLMRFISRIDNSFISSSE